MIGYFLPKRHCAVCRAATPYAYAYGIGYCPIKSLTAFSIGYEVYVTMYRKTHCEMGDV
ncbi:hypothetical protein LQZ18_19445 [Lachnospiraceae bacterium ZAX-1]